MKLKRNKLVYGVGINDADYNVERFENGKMVWICPYYHKWRKMLERCYCPKWKARNPVYDGVTTAEVWHLFSTFRKWMIEQDLPLSYQLDKDILVPGNTVYGPDTCLLVPKEINYIFIGVLNNRKRGKYRVGVNYEPRSKKRPFRSAISISGKAVYLGCFDNEDDAHTTWRKAKQKQIQDVALTSYPKLKDALLNWSNNLEEILK